MTEENLRAEFEGAEKIYAPTLMETPEWQEINNRENILGRDTLLAELLDQPMMTTIEMLWVTRAMLTYYGKKNQLMQKIPLERLQKNISNLLRILVLLLDLRGEVPDENMRAYMTVKLRDACWGLIDPTRKYLEQL